METVQRSVVFTKPQYEWLNEQADQRGVRFSELLRRVVDDARDRANPGQPNNKTDIVSP